MHCIFSIRETFAVLIYYKFRVNNYYYYIFIYFPPIWNVQLCFFSSPQRVPTQHRCYVVVLRSHKPKAKIVYTRSNPEQRWAGYRSREQSSAVPLIHSECARCLASRVHCCAMRRSNPCRFAIPHSSPRDRQSQCDSTLRVPSKVQPLCTAWTRTGAVQAVFISNQ